MIQIQKQSQSAQPGSGTLAESSPNSEELGGEFGAANQASEGAYGTPGDPEKAEDSADAAGSADSAPEGVQNTEDTFSSAEDSAPGEDGCNPDEKPDGTQELPEADAAAENKETAPENPDAGSAEDSTNYDVWPPSAAEKDTSLNKDPEDEEDEDGEAGSMSLMDHLRELRSCLLRALLGAAVGFLLCYGVAEDLFHYLSLPLIRVMPEGTKFIYTSVPEGFFVYLKVALVAGIFAASPYIFYQIWSFVAPGLYQEEKRHVLPLALFSAFFFIIGALFCYFGVFPLAFTFFMSYSTGMITAMPSLNEYLGFALKLLIAFGLVFEMPLFTYFLARLGIVTAAKMRAVRRYAVLAVFIIAAILTPPDVFSQLLMAGPMLILYELSIFIAAVFGRKPKKPEDKKAAPKDEPKTEDGAAA